MSTVGRGSMHSDTSNMFQRHLDWERIRKLWRMIYYLRMSRYGPVMLTSLLSDFAIRLGKYD